MLGVIINTLTVIAGSLLGLMFKNGIPERLSSDIQKALGLSVLYIGISSAFKGSDILVMILSMVIGALIGSGLDFDERLNVMCKAAEAKLLETKLFRKFKGTSFSTGFISASLTFCIGAMTITGALESGLKNEHSIYIAKAMLDGVASVLFSISSGIGVIFSAASIFVVQGALVLLARALQTLLTNEAMIAEMISVGGLLIVGIGFNLMGIGKFKIANYVPAVIIVPLVYELVQLLPI